MDRETLWHLSRRLLFVVVCGIVVLVQTLPLPGAATSWPDPDLIVAIAFAWTLRRPRLLPPLLVGGVVLLADLILMRPPGLWALLVVLGCVYLAYRQKDLSQVMFGIDWAYAGGTIVVIHAVYYLLQFPLFLPTMAAAPLAMQALFTIASYPLVVFVSVRVFDISKDRKIEDI